MGVWPNLKLFLCLGFFPLKPGSSGNLGNRYSAAPRNDSEGGQCTSLSRGCCCAWGLLGEQQPGTGDNAHQLRERLYAVQGKEGCVGKGTQAGLTPRP